MTLVRVQAEDFDPGTEIAALQQRAAGAGGLALFLGVVRSDAARPIAALTLDHYPGMTERALGAIAEAAQARFALAGCTIIHRHGRLLPGERIVLAAAAAAHRQPALDAVAFLMDWLKTRAPFWKLEHGLAGERSWVAARTEDDAAAAAWRPGPAK